MNALRTYFPVVMDGRQRRREIILHQPTIPRVTIAAKQITTMAHCDQETSDALPFTATGATTVLLAIRAFRQSLVVIIETQVVQTAQESKVAVIMGAASLAMKTTAEAVAAAVLPAWLQHLEAAVVMNTAAEGRAHTNILERSTRWMFGMISWRGSFQDLD